VDAAKQRVVTIMSMEMTITTITITAGEGQDFM